MPGITIEASDMMLDPEQCKSPIIKAVVWLVTGGFHGRRIQKASNSQPVAVGPELARVHLCLTHPGLVFETYLIPTAMIGSPASKLIFTMRAMSYCG